MYAESTCTGRIVSVQAKCENRAYGVKDVIDALKSLNPHSMFSTAALREREYWANNWRGLLLGNPNIQYCRILVCAGGFLPQACYFVHEYNRLHPTMPIVMLSLQSLENEMPQKAIDYIRDEIKIYSDTNGTSVYNPSVYEPNMIQCDWHGLTPYAKSKYKIEDLRMFCLERGIAQSKKSKGVLINDLNNYDAESAINSLVILN